MHRSSTSVMGLDDGKGRQELRPRGPSSVLPLSSVIKDAFEKFEHDFMATNLPESKYIKSPPSTTKWYTAGQPCYDEKIQELNTDFSEICITPTVIPKFPNTMMTQQRVLSFIHNTHNSLTCVNTIKYRNIYISKRLNTGCHNKI